VTPQEMVANAMLDRNQQANRLGIPQQMGAFANSLGMVPTPQQEALQEPLISPETYGIGTMLKKAAPMLPGALGMTVFHGSPHKFDKFDMSKIGTGEGAQAFGHGLYFAESPATAKAYADSVKDMTSVNAINDELTRLSRVMDNDSAGGYRQFKSQVGEQAAKQYDELMDRKMKTWDKPGNMYKVDLPDESIAKMLDWDKPLSQQPHVMQALKRLGVSVPDNTTGGQLMSGNFLKGLSDSNGIVLRPEEALRTKGIPGVRYLDGGSRTAGKGSSNYVVFDDTLPKIVGKE
jgi:hypothetical protein